MNNRRRPRQDFAARAMGDGMAVNAVGFGIADQGAIAWPAMHHAEAGHNR